METVELACEIRQTATKGDVRALRRSGRIPAVIYGPKYKPTPLVVSGAELKARVNVAARQRVMTLTSRSEDLNQRHVIIKEIQRAPISGEILHADFYEVDLAERIRVKIALRFTGRAVGVVDGGILQPLERHVEVECLPLEIPEYVEVDVTALGIHDVIHVSSIKFSDNVTPLYDSDYPVVTVLPPTVEEAPTPVVAAVEGVEAAPGEAAPEGGDKAAAPAGEATAKEGAPAVAAGGKKEGAPAAAAGGKKESAKK